MNTYLFAWNPKKWQWNNLPEISDAVKNGEDIIDRWSSGVSKKLQKGDRFFLIRLGEEPKGIIASGTIESNAFEDLHWAAEKSSVGKTANYVKIKYDILLNPETDAILPRELLNTPPLSEMHWDTQTSGIEIPENIASELEKLCGNVIAHYLIFSFPEEIDQTSKKVFEGAVKQITVNAYERSSVARSRCIEYYGLTCQVCSFNFEETYGETGKNFIHVHHLKQISEIGENYQIDPIRDLRPVCPNCHAIIHKRKPPYTIEEVKNLLKK